VGDKAPWATVDAALYSGTVAGTSATTIPIAINAAKLKPGTYRTTVVVQSQNAEPNPVKMPLTLTVTSAS
jgi:hypothetical protein